MYFVKRPLAILSLTFLISFCLFANFGVSAEWTTVLVLSLVPLLLLVFAHIPLSSKKLSLYLKYALLFVSGLFLSLALVCASQNGKEEKMRYAGETAPCNVQISSVLWESKQGFCYKARVLSVNGKEEDLFVALRSDNAYSSGDLVSGTVLFSAPHSSETFDEEKYLLSKNILLTGTLQHDVFTGQGRKNVLTFFSELSFVFQEKIRAFLPDDTAALACAVVFGDKSGISDEIKRDFAKIGISHIIAVSGMHVSFISVAFYKIAKYLGIHKKAAAFLCIILMLFYMGIAGFSASVVRAAILSCMMSFFIIAGFGYDGITALGICGSFMLVFCPHFAFDVGMQLSFSAYMGCIIGSFTVKKLFSLKISEPKSSLSKTDKKKKKPRPYIVTRALNYLTFWGKRALSSLIFSLVVVLFTLPVSCIYYDSLSLIAPLSNLIFIPLFSIVMYAGITVFLFSRSAFFGSAVAAAADWIISFTLRITERVSSLDNITVSLKYPFSPFLIAFIFVGLILLVSNRKKLSLTGALCVLLSVSIYAGAVIGEGIFLDDKHRISLINGKDGGSLLISTDCETILCNASLGSASEATVALNRAASLYKTDIDTVILTRYEEGHVNLMNALCSNTYPETVYLCAASNSKEHRIKAQLTSLLTEKKIDVREAESPSLDKINTKSCSLSLVKRNGCVYAVCVWGRSADYLYLSPHWSESIGQIKLLLKNEEAREGYAVFGYSVSKYSELLKAEKLFSEKLILAHSGSEALFESFSDDEDVRLSRSNSPITVLLE